MNFSVLMSVYYKENAEYFDLALKSNLVDQSVKPDEFVLICDGALNTALDCVIDKYVKEFPDIMKVYRLPTNVGLGKALNFGLEKCTYELVARSDSDDICVKERFEKQLDFLKNHAEVSILGGSIAEFEDDPSKSVRLKKMPETNAEVYDYAKFRNPINHMTVIFKKSVIQRLGSYMHMPYLEDYFLWVRALANGETVANLSDVLVYARVGNGMVKRRGNKESIGGWRQIGRFMLDNGMITRLQYVRNILSIYIFVYMPVFLREVLYEKLLREGRNRE